MMGAGALVVLGSILIFTDQPEEGGPEYDEDAVVEQYRCQEKFSNSLDR